MRLLVATTNRNKLREIRGIMAGLAIGIDGLDAYPAVDQPEETGVSFAENARLKAVYYANRLGVAAVAEDSGLEVDALGGEPGVHSARYGGEGADTYARKFALIYDALHRRNVALGTDAAAARFVCALAVTDGEHVVFEARGTIEGCIAPAPRGSGGFGYDPIFLYPPRQRTLAELSDDEKSVLSHRGVAFRQLRAQLAADAPWLAALSSR
jgi:XTP/dITP diphosphohydrolase